VLDFEQSLARDDRRNSSLDLHPSQEVLYTYESANKHQLIAIKIAYGGMVFANNDLADLETIGLSPNHLSGIWSYFTWANNPFLSERNELHMTRRHTE
jgi:hypothetical protein